MRRRHPSFLFHLAVLLGAFLLVTAPSPAMAIAARQAAAAMAAKAAAAFQAGDLARSAQFYLQAFREDPSEPAYLYSAARAEHMAGHLDRAEDQYRQFLTTPGADPTRSEHARGYLHDLAVVRADARATEAEQSAQKGAWKVAAATWLDAWRMAPERQRYLFKAARAQHEAGDKDAAIANLRAYLREAPTDAAERGEAEALLEQMGAHAQAVPPQKSTSRQESVPDGGLVVPAAAPDRSAARWTLGIGCVTAATGVGLVAWGLSEAANYRRDLNYDGTTVHGTLTYAQATNDVSTIRSHWIAGGVLAGVGAVAAGWGGWMLGREPGKAAVLVPTPNGAAFAGRF